MPGRGASAALVNAAPLAGQKVAHSSSPSSLASRVAEGDAGSAALAGALSRIPPGGRTTALPALTLQTDLARDGATGRLAAPFESTADPAAGTSPCAEAPDDPSSLKMATACFSRSA